MQERYDVAIIGSGPAGLSAALNAKIRNKKFIIFGSSNLSSKLERAPKINNYLGFYGISGEDLKEKFLNHIKSMKIDIKNERINNIYAMGEYFTLMGNEEIYESNTVIIATGVEYTKALDGEEEFLGKGVGYCATCDAPLYKNKTVSIISYNKEGEKDANYVSELAKTVYYIPMYRGEYNINDKITIIEDKPVKIIGEEKVEKLILKENNLITEGIFLLKDSISPKELVPGLKIVNGHVEVKRNMETNIKGCFAAGDCTGKPYQYIKAAGEGNIAVLSAVAYLDSLK
ncbi:NAD(P)/FAD-dependent oxidoreductase [Clostridium botulinum]|uniref:NAD(P)/FAD-dependent oxidoreductase n=1 Tax=Clostridium botulinum TaxID=1491 RepID=A0A6B4JJD3_CLOBO|nr:NAD(P)/FAD-dependent oxidoreductase [Clostridium botulinum]EES49818.1 tRNA uridine 5-carboxymethylaminomethyl modification enzyme GidA [Clostridium botulinum E1 str. 'BoNT E Beluga']MBY6760337.1 NAD(P)/FAD-dependent oxidoreductase [Clostridium botulinum]MBY6919244.1 NAD(P)/FAD-dependent oxidoreductase [Clostridium botulinum]MCR1130121.1 NAD(P)/FAD-dependent oxidoreductase [Clostridium botulinum]NFH69796.1 NAD(P)/FAD-dependent oxidoreductase [Clostridium botulinum]